jgi:hypothetical protein
VTQRQPVRVFIEQASSLVDELLTALEA